MVPPECVDPQFQGECHANHIRKMQASFSWDWGPAFPSMGIWQPIALETYTSAVLRYVKWTTVDVNQDEWECNVGVVIDWDFENGDPLQGRVKVVLCGVDMGTFDVAPIPSTGEIVYNIYASMCYHFRL